MSKITFRTSGKVAEFDDDEEVNVLRVSIRYGCGVPFKCASGNCGTDRVFIEEGAEHLSPIRRKERERLGDEVDHGYRLACQTYANGDVTVTWDPDRAPVVSGRAKQLLTDRWLAAKDTD